jgi:hypothetical protein
MVFKSAKMIPAFAELSFSDRRKVSYASILSVIRGNSGSTWRFLCGIRERK